MPQHFLDSSALLKRYRSEPGSQWMLELPAKSERVVVARLAHVEVVSAIVRRSRETGGTSAQVANVLATFEREMQEIFEVIELQGTVISRAVAVSKAHALRAADAIQLACALLACPEPPASMEFYLVSADNELNVAATAEGLQVENPNLHP